MHTESDKSAKKEKRAGRIKWLRIAGVTVLVTALIVQGVVLWPTFSDSFRALRELHIGWFAACVAAMAVSMSGFGGVQRTLLRAGNVAVSQRRSEAVIYSATSMTLTLPAGQVFSAAFTYRQTRRWGATHVVASWQLAMAGVIATATLAVVGAVGALAVGTTISPVTLAVSFGGIFAIVLTARFIQKHPSRLEAISRRGLIVVNRLRRRPRSQGVHRIRSVLDQIEAVRMNKWDALRTFWWSIVHRSADVACMGFACLAVGAEPRISGVIIAFAASKAVGSVPLAPGGLGTVDATLFATLTISAGLPASQALATVFVYRLVSLVLVNIVGWIVFFFLFRADQAEDAQLDHDFAEQAVQKADETIADTPLSCDGTDPKRNDEDRS
ncbi:UPF0104 family protein [Hoyosella rhizosphaerae]|uniref:Uncharacterized protein n=2 Tax=Hoyosella rhizosphaerae TaxID=1755582 RepID=A0A916U849_9ACTN|nr:UPF0104 family protein [Hoyosella rhizosphaerae]GGC62675.1 hypothetical protein GCM10011410_13890 [Hoyosella rhizosphaerae]